MTRTKTQQAAIDQLRASKHAAETVVETPVLTAPTVEADDAVRMQDQINEFICGMFKNIAKEMVPTKRGFAAFFGCCLAAAGVTTVIGKIAATAIIVVVATTGSMMIAYLMMFVALILSAYASLKAGEKVSNYILSGQIDRDVINVKNKVLSFFKKAPLTVASA